MASNSQSNSGKSIDDHDFTNLIDLTDVLNDVYEESAIQRQMVQQSGEVGGFQQVFLNRVAGSLGDNFDLTGIGRLQAQPRGDD